MAEFKKAKTQQFVETNEGREALENAAENYRDTQRASGGKGYVTVVGFGGKNNEHKIIINKKPYYSKE